VWQNGALESRGNLAFCIKPPVTNAVIKNNIFSGSLGDYEGWFNCAVNSDFNNISNPDSILINWQGEELSWPAYVKASGQDGHSITTDPLFVDPSKGDFSLFPQSPNVDSGSPLAQTTSAGSGKTISVDDARYFTDGFGLMDGDTIRIGEATAVVSGVDHISNTIIVDRPIQWEKGDSVSYNYAGMNPDRGAKEMGVIDKNTFILIPLFF
jgi:hypothetical protein